MDPAIGCHAHALPGESRPQGAGQAQTPFPRKGGKNCRTPSRYRAAAITSAPRAASGRPLDAATTEAVTGINVSQSAGATCSLFRSGCLRRAKAPRQRGRSQHVPLNATHDQIADPVTEYTLQAITKEDTTSPPISSATLVRSFTPSHRQLYVRLERPVPASAKDKLASGHGRVVVSGAQPAGDIRAPIPDLRDRDRQPRAPTNSIGAGHFVSGKRKHDRFRRKS